MWQSRMHCNLKAARRRGNRSRLFWPNLYCACSETAIIQRLTRILSCGYVVLNMPTTASASQFANECRRRICRPCTLGSRPGHLHRRRPGDADSRTEDGIEVLRGASTTTPNPSLGTERNLADTRGRFGIIMTGLWECRAIVGLPVYLIRRLQSVMNASARMIH